MVACALYPARKLRMLTDPCVCVCSVLLPWIRGRFDRRMFSLVTRAGSGVACAAISRALVVCVSMSVSVSVPVPACVCPVRACVSVRVCVCMCARVWCLCVCVYMCARLCVRSHFGSSLAPISAIGEQR